MMTKINWHDWFANKARSRELNIAVNLIMGVWFLAMLFFIENWWASVIIAWSSGAQFGYATLWFLQPHITKRWKDRMEKEIAIMTAQVFHKITREAFNPEGKVFSIVPDDTPPTHGRMN